MASIRYGQGVADVVGSVGGTTHLRNASGAYIRNRSRQSNPQTPNQSLARSRFGAVSASWSSLTDVDRQAWESFATSRVHPKTDRLGQELTLSGSQAFNEAQAVAALWSLPPFEVPPPGPYLLPSLINNGSFLRYNNSTKLLQALRVTVRASSYPVAWRVAFGPPLDAGAMASSSSSRLLDGPGGKGEEEDEPEPGGGGLNATNLYRALYGSPTYTPETVVWLSVMATAANVPFFGPPLTIRLNAVGV